MDCPGASILRLLGQMLTGLRCRAFLGGATCAGGAPFKRAALVFAHAAPYAGVLAGLEGPLQAGVYDRAPAADALGFLDLQEGRSCVPNGEKQFRVLVKARCAVTPIHADQLLHFWEMPL